jgi:hypothetical protein
MLDRLILSAVLGVAGFSGLFPEPPTPMDVATKSKRQVGEPSVRKKEKVQTVKEIMRKVGKT